MLGEHVARLCQVLLYNAFHSEAAAPPSLSRALRRRQHGRMRHRWGRHSLGTRQQPPHLGKALAGGQVRAHCDG